MINNIEVQKTIAEYQTLTGIPSNVMNKYLGILEGIIPGNGIESSIGSTLRRTIDESSKLKPVEQRAYLKRLADSITMVTEKVKPPFPSQEVIFEPQSTNQLSNP